MSEKLYRIVDYDPDGPDHSVFIPANRMLVEVAPDATLQDIAKILPDLIELAAEGIGYTSDYFRDKWEMDERLEEIVENPVIVELLNDDS